MFGVRTVSLLSLSLSLKVFCLADRTCGANWTYTGERHPVIFWCCYYFRPYGFTLDLTMVRAGIMYLRSCGTSRDGAWSGSKACVYISYVFCEGLKLKLSQVSKVVPSIGYMLVLDPDSCLQFL